MFIFMVFSKDRLSNDSLKIKNVLLLGYVVVLLRYRSITVVIVIVVFRMDTKSFKL
jgi:hypothetical protein